MLSNAYFLAKIRFDTAENEPAKNLQNFRKMHFRKPPKGTNLAPNALVPRHAVLRGVLLQFPEQVLLRRGRAVPLCLVRDETFRDLEERAVNADEDHTWLEGASTAAGDKASRAWRGRPAQLPSLITRLFN